MILSWYTRRIRDIRQVQQDPNDAFHARYLYASSIYRGMGQNGPVTEFWIFIEIIKYRPSSATWRIIHSEPLHFESIMRFCKWKKMYKSLFSLAWSILTQSSFSNCMYACLCVDEERYFCAKMNWERRITGENWNANVFRNEAFFYSFYIEDLSSSTETLRTKVFFTKGSWDIQLLRVLPRNYLIVRIERNILRNLSSTQNFVFHDISSAYF